MDAEPMTERDEMVALQAWCDEQASKIGAVDGYDYRSGEEAAYRHVSIEIGKRLAALRSAARTDADGAGFEACREACEPFLLAIQSIDDECPHDLLCGDEESIETAIHEYDQPTVGDLRKLARAIAALPAPGGITTGWQAIETAPKDGTVILVRRDNGCGDDHAVVWWCASHDEGYPWLSEFNAYAEDRWDYWMPLPPEPTITRKSEERS